MKCMCHIDNNKDDSNLNAKLWLKYEDLIRDLDGIWLKDLGWFLKKYWANNGSTFDTDLQIVKRHWVDNNKTDDTELECIAKKKY